MRVWEYAKQCGLKTKELLRILDENGVYNKTAQSSISAEEIQKTLIAINEEEQPVKLTPVEIDDGFYNIKTELVDKYEYANYFVALSPRGVGKSTGGLLLCIKTYIDEGNPSVLIRRREVELDAGKLSEVFGEIIALGVIQWWSKGKWNSIHTIGMRSYLCRRDDDGKVIEKDKQWFLYGVALNVSINIKGIQMNREADGVFVRWILFDELIPTDNDYLCNEGNLFFNALSTIIRHYNKAKILLFGNCIVGSQNEILETFGLDSLEMFKLKPGEIRLYKYDSEIEEDINWVVIQMIDKRNYKTAKKNNKYFNFGSKVLSQITGEFASDDEYGVWEIDKGYPALKNPYSKNDVLTHFYWIYGNDIFRGDIVLKDESTFIFNYKTNHKFNKTQKWLNEDNEIIFSEIWDPRPNWFSSLDGTKPKIISKIIDLIRQNRCCYQNAWVYSYFKSLFNSL